MNTLFISLLFLRLFLITSSVDIWNLVDQDNFRNSAELIESRGFKAQSHSVTTSDGYILTVFRIINPFVNKTIERPVVLWHGITLNSDSWLSTTPGVLKRNGVYVENSVQNDCRLSVTSNLAYTLSACGYDVWVPNTRGTDYSRRHEILDPESDRKYWEFTFTELGVYDVRAVVEHVLNVTKQDSLGYIGHSLGANSMFVLQSLDPGFERFVKPFIALAPFVYMSHMRSSLRFVAPFEHLLRSHPMPIGLPVPIAQFISIMICSNQYFNELCLDSFVYGVSGYPTKPDLTNFNRTRLPIYLSHNFRPFSSWIFSQIAQLIRSGGFTLFDYGDPADNLAHYGQVGPPDYPLSRITSPNIAIYYGFNDFVSNITDVKILIHSLKVPLLDNYMMPSPEWSHLDFQMAINQGFYLNKRILNVLKLFD